MSNIFKSSSSGGGTPITTINGDTGSITGSTVTIFANNAVNNSGKTVKFVNSGATSTLDLSDIVNNTYIGTSAGVGLSASIQDNTSVGTLTLASLTSAVANNAFGFSSLNALTSGGGNNAFGTNSLKNITTGNFNIALGNSAGGNYTTSDGSNIVIGNPGVTGESNTTRIGNQGNSPTEQNKCFIAGIVNVTTAQSAVTTINPSTTQLATVLAGNIGNVLTDNGTNWVSAAPSGGGIAGTQSFFAYLSVSTGAVTGDTTTVTIPFDTALFNNGSNFDTTNHWYVAPATGIYQFNVNGIVTNSGGTNTGLFLELMNGATTYFLGYDVLYNVAQSSGTANASATIPCTAGDHIFVNIAVNGNLTKNVVIAGGNSGFTSFSGYRVA